MLCWLSVLRLTASQSSFHHHSYSVATTVKGWLRNPKFGNYDEKSSMWKSTRGLSTFQKVCAKNKTLDSWFTTQFTAKPETSLRNKADALWSLNALIVSEQVLMNISASASIWSLSASVSLFDPTPTVLKDRNSTKQMSLQTMWILTKFYWASAQEYSSLLDLSIDQSPIRNKSEQHPPTCIQISFPVLLKKFFQLCDCIHLKQEYQGIEQAALRYAWPQTRTLWGRRGVLGTNFVRKPLSQHFTFGVWDLLERCWTQTIWGKNQVDKSSWQEIDRRFTCHKLWFWVEITACSTSLQNWFVWTSGKALRLQPWLDSFHNSFVNVRNICHRFVCPSAECPRLFTRSKFLQRAILHAHHNFKLRTVSLPFSQTLFQKSCLFAQFRFNPHIFNITKHIQTITKFDGDYKSPMTAARLLLSSRWII